MGDVWRSWEKFGGVWRSLEEFGRLYGLDVFYSDFKIYGSLNNFLSNLSEFKLTFLLKNNFTTFTKK